MPQESPAGMCFAPSKHGWVVKYKATENAKGWSNMTFRLNVCKDLYFQNRMREGNVSRTRNVISPTLFVCGTWPVLDVVWVVPATLAARFYLFVQGFFAAPYARIGGIILRSCSGHVL